MSEKLNSEEIVLKSMFWKNPGEISKKKIENFILTKRKIDKNKIKEFLEKKIIFKKFNYEKEFFEIINYVK